MDVRRALAQVIDRSAVQKVGETVSGTASEYTTGMIDSVVSDWMSPSDIARLKTYDHDTGAAEALLKKAGLTKGSDGTWMLPDGKPWKLDIDTVNGFSDWIAAAKVISSELTDFGIEWKPRSCPTTRPTSVPSRRGSTGRLLADRSRPAVLLDVRPDLRRADGYNVVGDKVVHYPASAKGKGNWIGGPTSYTVPGGGTIDRARRPTSSPTSAWTSRRTW